METSKNNSQDPQNIDGRLGDLIKEAGIINQAIREDGDKARREIDLIIAKINETIATINQNCYELDQIEKDAGEKIGQILSEEKEYLADNG